MRENQGGGKFISLEQSKFYYDKITGNFPPELSASVQIVLAESVDVALGDILGCRYAFEQRDPIDLLYIDGPSQRSQFDNKNLPQAISADILFVPKSEKFFAILDQRVGTMLKLRQLMPDHDVRYSVIKRQTFIAKKS